MKKPLGHAIVPQTTTMKEAMRHIDASGLRVVFVTDEHGAVIGAVSDSEIRKSILRGVDIRSEVRNVVNPDPILLTEDDMKNGYAARQKARLLSRRMPDSRYILLVDGKRRPKKLALLQDIAETGTPARRAAASGGSRVLIVGGAGYLGSVLVRQLLSLGYNVKVLDNLMYGDVSLKDIRRQKNLAIVRGDMRNISTLVSCLSDVDAVINLAAIVGDPACKNRPEMAIETNYFANKSLAEVCKYHQVNRFIYASTCSVYGAMEGTAELDENAPLRPVSLYARSKIQSEEGILSLEDENFSPTILRMSTLYGYSPRMRFDLVVNTMTKTAVCEKKIHVHGGGTQWRPLLHVDDAARAYIACLTAPIKRVKGQVFNVGSSAQNYRIIDIARAVNKIVPESRIVLESGNTDARNYVVSFAKIQKVLAFRAQVTVPGAIKRIKKALIDGEIRQPNDGRYYNVESV